MEVFEPPCVVKDVISHVFSYDGLQSYLVYLEEKSKKAFSQIFDITNKMNDLLSLKDELKELNNKFELISIKQEEMHNTLNFHSQKLIDIEANETEIQERLSILEKENSKNQNRLNNIEENIAYLTKISEDTVKNLEKTNLNVNTLKTITDNQSLEIQKLNDKVLLMKNEIDKIHVLENNFNDFKNFSFNKFKKIKEKRKLFQAKQVEMEINISKLFDLYTEIGMDLKNRNSGKNSEFDNKRDNLLSNRSRSDGFLNVIPNFDFTAFYNEYNENKLKLENLLKELIDNKKKRKSFGEPFGDDDSLNFKGEEDIIGGYKKLSKENVTNDIIVDMINSFQDSLKTIGFHLSIKANKDELEKLMKHIIHDLEKNQSKTTDSILKLESKIKNNSSNSMEHSIHEKQELIKIIEKLTKEYISCDLNQIINDSIMANLAIKGLFIKTENISEEINKLSKFMDEIRIDRNEDDNKEDKKVMRELEQAYKNKTEQNIIELKLKLSDLEATLIDLKRLFENNIQGTSEEEEDEKNKEVSSTNLRDYIKNVYQTVRNVIDRLDKVTFKQESMNTEILGKVKKDLTSESNRILEEFRGDLKISIGKIEDQLREKVDRFNLDEFGKRMDNKFIGEINKKIDKHDLKKNNILFNKKFDNLENKISKTLVDTLIDLQMEEAPLIVKKGAQTDKCGSCNQLIPTNLNMTQSAFSPAGYNMINSVLEDNSRFKLRAIQDISNKFGTGSYSRILSNVNTETLNDDLKSNLKLVSNSIHLPNIKYKSNLNSPKRKNMSLGKIDEINERNTVFEEEKKVGTDSLRKEKKK